MLTARVMTGHHLPKVQIAKSKSVKRKVQGANWKVKSAKVKSAKSKVQSAKWCEGTCQKCKETWLSRDGRQQHTWQEEDNIWFTLVDKSVWVLSVSLSDVTFQFDSFQISLDIFVVKSGFDTFQWQHRRWGRRFLFEPSDQPSAWCSSSSLYVKRFWEFSDDCRQHHLVIICLTWNTNLHSYVKRILLWTILS